MILFLDFDGVRLPERFGEDQSFYWIYSYQLILSQLQKIMVIAPSTLRLSVSLNNLKGQLYPELKDRNSEELQTYD